MVYLILIIIKDLHYETLIVKIKGSVSKNVIPLLNFCRQHIIFSFTYFIKVYLTKGTVSVITSDPLYKDDTLKKG